MYVCTYEVVCQNVVLFRIILKFFLSLFSYSLAVVNVIYVIP